MLLIDVDAAVKLAHWDLLNELPMLTGMEWNELATISSLRYRALRSTEHPDGKLFRTAIAAETVFAAMKHMADLPEPNMTCLAALQGNTGIDPGEAVLLSILHVSDETRLLTGDRRALRTLAQLDRQIKDSFCNRILVIEQILIKALDTYGLDWLRERVCQDMHADKAVAICMGSRCDAPEASVSCGLNSYICEIGNLTDPSLLGKLS